MSNVRLQHVVALRSAKDLTLAHTGRTRVNGDDGSAVQCVQAGHWISVVSLAFVNAGMAPQAPNESVIPGHKRNVEDVCCGDTKQRYGAVT